MPTSSRKVMHMELPNRKPNRIPDFDYRETCAYFVTLCTENRKPVLSEIVGDDAHIVPKPYGHIAEKYIRNVPEIEKYVIMPDHIHMLIRLDNGTMWASSPTERTEPLRQNRSVSNIVRSIKILTTKEIGMSIWQRSYYDHVVRNQHDYNEIWEYIEYNPIKWAMKHNGST